MANGHIVTACMAGLIGCGCASARVLEGDIVARDARSWLASPATHPQERVVFMRVNPGVTPPRYSKLVYRWFDQADAMPVAVVEQPGRWSARARRDVGCDESIGTIARVPFVDVTTGQATDAIDPVQYLQTAGQQRIPAEAKLECYQVVTNGWRRVQK